MNYFSLRYDIDTIDYIDVMNGEKPILACLNGSKTRYVDIRSYFEDRAKVYDVKTVSLISSLSDMVAEYGIGVILLNAKGETHKDLSREEAFRLLNIINNIKKLDQVERDDIYNIASEVANVCCTLLKVSKEKRADFEALLKGYVLTELIETCVLDKKVATTKRGELIDYKVNRIMKFLGARLNLKKIEDFEVKYNRNGIDINGNEYFRVEDRTKTIGTKINRIVRQ